MLQRAPALIPYFAKTTLHSLFNYISKVSSLKVDGFKLGM
jgi:hypothetical protein